MNNFLYCFDENYNIPAFCSMFSILENANVEINIFVIHKLDKENISVPDKINNHKNLKSINFYKASLKNNFPNLIDVHVTEATYYRLFIEDFIKEDIGFITYVDCDVICINNPIKTIKEHEEILAKKNLSISVLEEHGLSEYGFSNFGIESGKYFNAGVMIINLQKWKKDKLKDNFLEIIEKHSKKLLFWDQDVMNIHFNGNYHRLDPNLNTRVPMEEGSELNILTMDQKNKIIFLHYAGKFKPWSIKGILNINSSFFHKNYELIFNKKYFILYIYKINAIKDLLKGIVSLKFMKLKHPIKFLLLSINSIFFKKNKT